VIPKDTDKKMIAGTAISCRPHASLLTTGKQRRSPGVHQIRPEVDQPQPESGGRVNFTASLKADVEIGLTRSS
jgi:hypothetical protein